MPFPGILGGFKTRQKQFFCIFLELEKKSKKKFSRKNRFYRKNWRFFADFFSLDFSIPISFLAPPKSAIFLSIVIIGLMKIFYTLRTLSILIMMRHGNTFGSVKV